MPPDLKNKVGLLVNFSTGSIGAIILGMDDPWLSQEASWITSIVIYRVPCINIWVTDLWTYFKEHIIGSPMLHGMTSSGLISPSDLAGSIFFFIILFSVAAFLPAHPVTFLYKGGGLVLIKTSMSSPPTSSEIPTDSVLKESLSSHITSLFSDSSSFSYRAGPMTSSSVNFTSNSAWFNLNIADKLSQLFWFSLVISIVLSNPFNELFSLRRNSGVLSLVKADIGVIGVILPLKSLCLDWSCFSSNVSISRFLAYAISLCMPELLQYIYTIRRNLTSFRSGFRVFNLFISYRCFSIRPCYVCV